MLRKTQQEISAKEWAEIEATLDSMRVQNDIEQSLDKHRQQVNESQLLWGHEDEDATKVTELVKAWKLGSKMKTQMLTLGTPTRSEIKSVVDTFYQVQKNREAAEEQMRAIHAGVDTGVPGNDIQPPQTINTVILDYLLKNFVVIEAGIGQCLEIVCQQNEVGRWLMSIRGMGPVLSAGLMAYLDITRVNYASQFISYAGLNDKNRPWLGHKGSDEIMNELAPGNTPVDDFIVAEFAARTQWKFEYLREKAWDEDNGKWSKANLIAAAAKVPYNRDLKTLMWKIGSSFHWQCNKKESLYGTFFSQRRIEEIRRNEAGMNAEYAAKILRTRNIGCDTNAYKEYAKGKLPKAHINARAMRVTEKLFLSHVFEEMYRAYYHKLPPRYYALEHLEGAHNVEIAPEVPYTWNP